MPQMENFDNSKQIEDIKSQVAQISEETGSTRIKFSYLWMQFESSYKNYQFRKALKFAIELKYLIKTSKLYHSKQNLAGGNWNIALAKGRMGKCEEAAKLMSETLRHLNINGVNSLNIQNDLFCMYLNLREFDKAKKVLKSIENHRIIQNNPYETASIIHQYHIAYMYYVQKDYRNAIIHLHKCDSLNKLNRTWFWASLVLEVIILIEQDLFDIAASRAGNLMRILKKDKLKAPRIRYMAEVLNHSLKNYNTVKQVLTKHLKNKKERDHLPPSDPFGYEIIAFEKWMETYCLPEPQRA